MGTIPNKIRYIIYVINIIAFILSILDFFYNFGFNFMYAFFIIVASAIIFFIDGVISIKISKPPYLTPKERKMKKLYEKNYITAAALKTGIAERGWAFIPDKGEYGYSGLNLYKTFLILKVSGKQFKLDYKDIDYIKKNTRFTCFPSLTAEAVIFINAVQIKHHADIPKHVYLKGKNLYNEMEKVAKKNKLKLKFVD